MDLLIVTECTGFDWDEGNKNKNATKHSVSWLECEQIFFNKPLLLEEDIHHSHTEQRFYALGKTDENRQLFVAFTIRNNLIRVISARDMSKRERKYYEQA